MKRVKDYISAKTISVRPDCIVEVAVRKMVLSGITGMPVTDKEGKLLGMFSITDVLSRAYPSFKSYYENPEIYNDFSDMEDKVPDLAKKKVEDFMSTKIHTVTPDMPLMKAFSLRMRKKLEDSPLSKEEL